MKIVGIEERKGTFEGNDYHNIIFHCTLPLDKDKSAGLKTKEVKVKHKVLSETFDKVLTEKEILSFVGQDVKFYYDEYKNVSHVDIQKETVGSVAPQKA